MYSIFLVIHDMPLNQRADMDYIRLQMMIAVMDGKISLHPANSDVRAIDFTAEDQDDPENI